VITGRDLYDKELRPSGEDGVRDLTKLFFALALDGVRAAARELG
jgi:hypothetical protein